jgi:hypothetical protein
MNLVTNPIELTAAGQSYDDECRILAIVWEGATTAGDTVELRYQGAKLGKIWRGRANDTHTYLGLNAGPHGLHAPGGFKVQALSAGTLLVYLRED